MAEKLAFRPGAFDPVIPLAGLSFPGVFPVDEEDDDEDFDDIFYEEIKRCQSNFFAPMTEPEFYLESIMNGEQRFPHFLDVVDGDEPVRSPVSDADPTFCGYPLDACQVASIETAWIEGLDDVPAVFGCNGYANLSFSSVLLNCPCFEHAVGDRITNPHLRVALGSSHGHSCADCTWCVSCVKYPACFTELILGKEVTLRFPQRPFLEYLVKFAGPAVFNITRRDGAPAVRVKTTGEVKPVCGVTTRFFSNRCHKDCPAPLDHDNPWKTSDYKVFRSRAKHRTGYGPPLSEEVFYLPSDIVRLVVISFLVLLVAALTLMAWQSYLITFLIASGLPPSLVIPTF